MQYQELSSFCFCFFAFSSFPSSDCVRLTPSSGCVCLTSSSGCVRLTLSLRFRLLSKRENIHIHLLHLIAFHLPATVKVDIHRSSAVLSQTRIQPRWYRSLANFKSHDVFDDNNDG